MSYISHNVLLQVMAGLHSDAVITSHECEGRFVVAPQIFPARVSHTSAIHE